MRVNLVSPEIIEMMKKPHNRLRYGDGKQERLNIMKKRVASRDNCEAIRYAVDACLYTIPQLVVGMLGETLLPE